MAVKGKIKVQDLDFIALYTKRKLNTNRFGDKVIEKVYIPHDLCIGREGVNGDTVIFGDLIVCGSFDSSGSSITGNNVGGATGKIFRDKSGDLLNFKTIEGIGGITVTNNASTITISGSSGGGGSITSGTNVGVGTGEVHKDISGNTLRFRTLSGTNGISIVTNTNEVQIGLEGRELQYYHGYSTGSFVFDSATWENAVNVIGNTTITDTYEVGITRSNLSWTFTSGGVYFADITVNANMTNRHFGLRLSSSSGIRAESVGSVGSSADMNRGTLQALMTANAGEVVTLQYALDTVNPLTWSNVQIDGEYARSANFSFFNLAAASGTIVPAVEPLDQTLREGDFTGGSNIVLTSGDQIIGEGSTTGAPAIVQGGSGSSGAGGFAVLGGGQGTTIGGAAFVQGGSGTNGGNTFISGGAGNLNGGIGGSVFIAPGTTDSLTTQTDAPVVQIANFNHTDSMYPVVRFKNENDTAPLTSSWYLDVRTPNVGPEGFLGENEGAFYMDAGYRAFSTADNPLRFPGLAVKRVNSGSNGGNQHWYYFGQVFSSGTIISDTTVSGTLANLESLVPDPRTGASQDKFVCNIYDIRVTARQDVTTGISNNYYTRQMRAVHIIDEESSINSITYDYLSLPITEGEGVNYDCQLLTTGTDGILLVATGSSTENTFWSFSWTAGHNGGNFINRGMVGS